MHYFHTQLFVLPMDFNNYDETKILYSFLPAVHHRVFPTTATDDYHLEVLHTNQECEHSPVKISQEKAYKQSATAHPEFLSSLNGQMLETWQIVKSISNLQEQLNARKKENQTLCDNNRDIFNCLSLYYFQFCK